MCSITEMWPVLKPINFHVYSQAFKVPIENGAIPVTLTCVDYTQLNWHSKTHTKGAEKMPHCTVRRVVAAS